MSTHVIYFLKTTVGSSLNHVSQSMSLGWNLRLFTFKIIIRKGLLILLILLDVFLVGLLFVLYLVLYRHVFQFTVLDMIDPLIVLLCLSAPHMTVIMMDAFFLLCTGTNLTLQCSDDQELP